MSQGKCLVCGSFVEFRLIRIITDIELKEKYTSHGEMIGVETNISYDYLKSCPNCNVITE